MQGQFLEQVVHAHSKIDFVFSSYSSKNTKCIGDSIVPKVQAQGTGPWTLHYNVNHGFQTVKKSVEIQPENPTIELSTLVFDESGSYSIDLVNLKDGNGCIRNLENEPLTVEVLPSRPSVGFQSVKSVYALEGKMARLPITISGRGPFNVKYRNLNNPATIQTSTLATPTRFLDVSGSGDYELVGVSDRFCTGNMSKNAS